MQVMGLTTNTADQSRTSLAGLPGGTGEVAPYVWPFTEFTRFNVGLAFTRQNAYGYSVGPTSGLRLFKGTIPTASTVQTDTNLSIAPAFGADWTFRSTDKLVHFPIITSSSTGPQADGTIKTALSGAAAVASGEATWFVHYLGPYQVGIGNTSVAYALVGTVTGPGGGGDIELLSTTITSGQFYKVYNINIPLPLKIVW